MLATGLGKTWLSAFDSTRPVFNRILFVAHREEILSQAMSTFRTIKPGADLGYYNGSGKEPDADVVFASIQTLSKRKHLHRFDPHEFDYVIVDEFHHAAAQSYRRVLGYLEPKFLLGLTATPERMDGGDLLSLCGDNLVYRCDVAEGIRRGLLSPFDYYGVPDNVDYENIPWRSNRFDEEKLTQAVATEVRAENALDHYRKLGGSRTLAFCVSQRHADYMAEFFSNRDVRAVAVHAGGLSAPRAHSLEQLRDGELEIIFAVDMFNEGVDIPNIDTVLMLRPTESRNLWLQQFGRGLRHQDGKTLQVIDYIGNHRVFLNKIRALFNLRSGDREVAYALDRYESRDLELPEGCSVTYDLAAIDILRGLIRTSVAKDPLKVYYEEFKERNGARPLASEVFEDGYDPKAARKHGYASWFDFVRLMGDFSPTQTELVTRFDGLFRHLEVTPMTKSYKMLVLMAILDDDAFPGEIPIERLTERFGALARRHAGIRSEVGEALADPVALGRVVEQNPVAAWTGGKGTGGTYYFSFDDGVLRTTFSVVDEHRESFQDLVRELAEWRLVSYLRRSAPNHSLDRIVCRVSHSNGRPILFLPDRSSHNGIPEGWQKVLADGEEFQANFVKIAINVMTRPGSTDNVLPQVLRSWFGNEAGDPGRSDDVVLMRAGDAYRMLPATDLTHSAGPLLWQEYSREAAFEVLGIKPKGWEPQQGIVRRNGLFILFVTLDKDTLAEEYQYKDHFVSAAEFQWQSQNQNSQAGKVGQEILHHEERGIQVHLFVRGEKSVNGAVAPLSYCGQLSFRKWEGEKPITVWWRLEHPVPEPLWLKLKVPADAGGYTWNPGSST